MGEFLDQLTSRNNPELNARLRAATVGIAGCGGLGSNVAIALARIGVGKLVLVDHDRVETSNLNRQQYFLDDIGRMKTDALSAIIRRFNPEIELTAHAARIDGENIFELFADCNVVVEAFDQAEDKSMIVESFGDDRFKDKTLVTASGLAGVHSANLIQTRKLSRNVYVCGDFVNGPCEGQGLMAPRVMIAAGHEANMVVRILSGQPDP